MTYTYKKSNYLRPGELPKGAQATFKYRTRRNAKQKSPANAPALARDVELLTGIVQGQQAAADEERFANAVYSLGMELIFRLTLGPPKGYPGWLELDALVNTSFGYRAFEIDDMTFVHRGEQERSEALLKDLKRLEYLRYMGLQIPEIEHVDAARLQNAQDAYLTVRELLR